MTNSVSALLADANRIRPQPMLRLVVLTAIVLGGFAGSPAAGFPLRAPVIFKSFTPLPCQRHPRTSVGLEGCYEKRVLITDLQINSRVKIVFTLLAPNARRVFVRGELAWLRYRNSSCLAEISTTAGGSGQPIRQAACEYARNKTHLIDLSRLLATLKSH